MRARHPDADGFVDRAGVRLYYEVYGEGDPTLLLVPTWCIFHSRFWKMQIPYLSRHFRVVTYDARGNGRSSRPEGVENHSWRHYVDDLLAVLDATDTDRVVLIGVSVSGYWSNLASVLHPGRVLGVVAIGPGAGLGIGHPAKEVYSYTDELDTTEGGPRRTSTSSDATTASTSSSSSPRSSPSRTPPSRSRTASPGRWRPTPRR